MPLGPTKAFVSTSVVEASGLGLVSVRVPMVSPVRGTSGNIYWV